MSRTCTRMNSLAPKLFIIGGGFVELFAAPYELFGAAIISRLNAPLLPVNNKTSIAEAVGGTNAPIGTAVQIGVFGSPLLPEIMIGSAVGLLPITIWVRSSFWIERHKFADASFLIHPNLAL